ncbi:MAG: coiled-coil protein [Methanosarcinales archaeon]
MLQELEEKKAMLIQKSKEFKENRDKLNREANKLSAKRNELNKKNKLLLKKAQELKKKRDEYNENVSKYKKKRDRINKKINKIYKKIDKLRKEKNLSGGPSIHELKKEIEELEFKQQTEVLTPSKERELVVKISALRDELYYKTAELESDEEIKALLDEAESLREKASYYHEKVNEFADLAQEYHDKMLDIYHEADKVRSESDAMHREFLKTLKTADKQHQQYLDAQNEIKDFTVLIDGLKRSSREGRQERARAKIRKEAEEIYNQFKLGEKLNTEDLMLLQRSGLL